MQRFFRAEERCFCLYRAGDMALNAVMAHAETASGDETRSFEDLLAAVGAGRDKEAFALLFQHFAPRIKSFLMRGGAAEDLADELAQETMLTVWRRAATYDPAQAAASTWIFTIARNKRIDALRRRGRPEVDIDDPLLVVSSDNTAPDEGLQRDRETKAIAKALEILPAEQAALIRKAYFEDKTQAEIAAEDDIPLGTVKSRLRLAMDKLRQELQGWRS